MGVVRDAMRKFKRLELIAPLLSALLVHGMACTTEVPDANKKQSSSSPNSTEDPGSPSNGTPSGPAGGTPSGSQPGSSSGAPENPKPGGTPDPSSSQEPGEQPKPGACENGEVDRNCHALEDGTPIEFPTGVPLGNCKAGTRICESNEWGPCKGAIPPQAEDNCKIPGDDASCDGVANAGCDCVTGETRPCGESDVGACKLGTQHCVDGQWEDACKGALYPKAERCDGEGIDEDCDGDADIADDQCECINDSTDYCERAGQEGDCKWGKRSCSEGAWGSCEAWAEKEEEICGTRPEVNGVIWTGDENCDGTVDTSSVGKKGPEGCVDMMLDQDGDQYGKLGPDLSNIKSSSQIPLIGTACLCPNRPDIDDMRKQGWTEKTFRANQDCGDCGAPHLNDGRDVYPGNRSSTTVSNRCLRHVGWTGHGGGSGLLAFDLNCDGHHTDPSGRGDLAVIRCKKSGAFSCTEQGAGRLILPSGQSRLNCGRRYEFGTCYAEIEESYELAAGTMTGEDGTGGGGGTGTGKPKKKFKGCKVRGTGRKHLIRCQ